MARKCTICEHPQVEAINLAIVQSTPNTRISTQFDVSEIAVRRHKKKHLPATLQKAHQEAAEAREVANGIDIMRELERCFVRANLLFDACDRWLRDPDDPGRYDIGPRAEDIRVTYVERGEDGRTRRRKAALSELLGRVAGVATSAELVETKHADPRELVLKAAAQLESQIELVAKLMGQLNEGGQVNVTVGTAVQVNDEQEGRHGWDLSVLDDDELDTLERLLVKVHNGQGNSLTEKGDRS